MAITISQSATAIGPGKQVSFLAQGGANPYTYVVVPGGAGGTIDPATGVYTAPASVSSDPNLTYDTIRAVDLLANFADTELLIGSPFLLFCEIIQREMGLADGRVWLYDQKTFKPTDFGVYIPVTVSSCKAFGNSLRTVPTISGLDSYQYVSMMATLDMDIISRGPDARDRKEEIILALNSIYSQSQQEINNFYIGKLPPSGRFINLSEVDGAAIPYRFRISANMQYAISKIKAVPYFDNYDGVAVTTDP